MQIEGKVCVVSGGSTGLGRGTADTLAARGARVAVLDLAAPAQPFGVGMIFHQIDVTDDAAVAAAVAAIAAQWGEIHVCVTCAGIVATAPVLGPEGMSPIATFRRTIDVNLTGTYIVLARTAERMVLNDPGDDGERGVIVTTSSIAALDASSSAAYAASKGGVASLTLTVARELGGRGVRVNSIAPGFMETAMFQGLAPDWTRELLTKTVFPKRLGDPKEFGALVAHIVENRFLNASHIRFDAGSRV
jgi:3-hydroxyacyl-CoA dehydrogenase / 3-hydroxy-2-methylbutyryl-CoA dehydrogenase